MIKIKESVLPELIIDKYVEDIVPKFFKEASTINVKNKNEKGEKVSVTYPTHIINAVFSAVSFYVYERVLINNRPLVPIKVKLLMAALTLHDVNKYVKNKYNFKNNGNTREVIDKYFQTDDFGIKDFFSDEEFDSLFDELIYLIQTTELRDKGQIDSIKYRPKYSELSDYARMGDVIASMSLHITPESDIYNKYKNRDLHFIEIPTFPHQLIRKILYASINTFIEENDGLPFLISQRGIFYLRPTKIDLQNNKIKEIFLNKINDNKLNVSVDNLNNQSFQTSSLSKLPVSFEKKVDVMIEETQKYFESNACSGNIKVTLPFDDTLKKNAVYIIYLIYQKNGLKRLKESIATSELIDSDKNNSVKDIDVLIEKYNTIRTRLNISSPVSKAYASSEFFKDIKNYETTISKISKILEQLVREDIDNASISFVDELISECTSDFYMDKLIHRPIPESKKDMCFLCGQKSDKEYKEGKKGHFIQSRGFSSRVDSGSKTKQICYTCDIEKNLLEKLILGSEYYNKTPSLTSDMLFVYFYFDGLWTNISYFNEAFEDATFTPKDMRITSFKINDFSTGVYIKPIPIKKSDNTSKQDERVNIILDILKMLMKNGCKAIIALPYSQINPRSELLINENPTSLEIAFKIDKITTPTEAKRAITLLNMIKRNTPEKGYYEVGGWNIFKLIRCLEKKQEIQEKKKQKKGKRLDVNAWVKNSSEDMEELFGSEIMEMNKVVEKGKLMFQEYPKSKSQTIVPIVTVVDTILNKEEKETAIENKNYICSEIFENIRRNQFTSKKNIIENIEVFCDFTTTYLIEAGYKNTDGSWNKTKLRNDRKGIINFYYYVFIKSQISKKTDKSDNHE